MWVGAVRGGEGVCGDRGGGDGGKGGGSSGLARGGEAGGEGGREAGRRATKILISSDNGYIKRLLLHIVQKVASQP